MFLVSMFSKLINCKAEFPCLLDAPSLTYFSHIRNDENLTLFIRNELVKYSYSDCLRPEYTI